MRGNRFVFGFFFLATIFFSFVTRGIPWGAGELFPLSARCVRVVAASTGAASVGVVVGVAGALSVLLRFRTLQRAERARDAAPTALAVTAGYDVPFGW